MLHGRRGVQPFRALRQPVDPLAVWDEREVREFLRGCGEETGPRDGVWMREVKNRTGGVAHLAHYACGNVDRDPGDVLAGMYDPNQPKVETLRKKEFYTHVVDERHTSKLDAGLEQRWDPFLRVPTPTGRRAAHPAHSTHLGNADNSCLQTRVLDGTGCSTQNILADPLRLRVTRAHRATRVC